MLWRPKFSKGYVKWWDIKRCRDEITIWRPIFICYSRYCLSKINFDFVIIWWKTFYIVPKTSGLAMVFLKRSMFAMLLRDTFSDVIITSHYVLYPIEQNCPPDRVYCGYSPVLQACMIVAIFCWQLTDSRIFRCLGWNFSEICCCLAANWANSADCLILNGEKWKHRWQSSRHSSTNCLFILQE